MRKTGVYNHGPGSLHFKEVLTIVAGQRRHQRTLSYKESITKGKGAESGNLNRHSLCLVVGRK